MTSGREVQCQPEISDRARQLVQDDLMATEAGLISGETLGLPVYPVSGIELDFTLAMSTKSRRWHEEDKPDAADDWATARQFGTIPHVIRYRRNQLFRHVPDLIRAELGALVPEDARQAVLRDRWLAQVEVLTVPELVNYLVYRDLSKPTLGNPDRDAETPDDLTNDDPQETAAFRFGQDECQAGWYDNPGFFEIRTNQAGLVVSVARKARIVRTLHKYADYYGLHLEIPNSQIHISYQTLEDGELTPLHDTSTPEGLELTRRITEGSMQTVSTVLPSVGQAHHRNLEVSDPDRYRAGPSRFNAFRVMPDQFELRYGIGEGDFTELTELTLAAGFISGVEDAIGVDGFNTRIIEKTWFEPGPGYDKVRDVGMLRILQVADFDTTGFAELPVGYLRQKQAQDIAKYLCGVSEVDDEWFDLLADPTDPVRGLISILRVTTEGRLVCDPDKFGAWMLDSATTSRSMQVILKQASDQPSASSITELLQRFEPMRIQTVN